MKKKVASIKISMEIDGKKEQIEFIPEQLRNWLRELKIGQNQEKISLQFSLDGKDYIKNFDVKKELPQVKRAVKYAELVEDFVPKNLKEYVTDFTQVLSKKNMSPLKGREHEIEKIWFYLSQKKRNNIFLIGPKEVGKTAIAKEIARQIATMECPKEFYDKRVITLQLNKLLKIKSDLIYEYMINRIIDFISKNKNKIVILIDEAIYMKTEELLISMLYSCIKKLNIPIIATSSEENYDDYFLGDPGLEKYVNYVYVEEPEYKELKPMIIPHIRKLKKMYSIDISDNMIDFAIYTSVLDETTSVNPGKIINILDKAFLEAKRKDKTQVDKKSILKCYNTYLRQYLQKPLQEKRATAYHETGHYLVMVKNNNQKNVKISCVSILPMMYWEGVTCSYQDTEIYENFSKEFWLDEIAAGLAGRVAEKKVTNTETIGAKGDLQQVNAAAKAMIMQFGFSNRNTSKNRQYTVEDLYLMPESKKEAIDKEIQEYIDEGLKRAEKIINDNEELLKIIAEKLLEEEILTGQQLEEICKEYEKTKNE